MTLADLINEVKNLALALVPAATIGLIVAAGAVIAGAAAIVNRLRRIGR